MRFRIAKSHFIERSSSFRVFISLVISMLEKEALEGKGVRGACCWLCGLSFVTSSDCSMWEESLWIGDSWVAWVGHRDVTGSKLWHASTIGDVIWVAGSWVLHWTGQRAFLRKRLLCFPFLKRTLGTIIILFTRVLYFGSWGVTSLTALQDAHKRLLLQVYLGSNTLEFSAIHRWKLC